ncbi:MAG TPA: mercuric reductase [Flavipsychrobacter sp.]|nr:mercuric reductase [Flavipsychrobacter sp.]
MKKYDAIIIGSGQAGTPLSRKLGKAGWKTAVIERRWVGGTCINDGCTPTKAMVASAKVASLAGRAAEWGVKVDHFSIDINAIIRRKDGVVHSFRDGLEKGITETPNVDLIYGHARFSGDKVVSVELRDGGTEELSADHIFINTGGRTAIPSIPGLEKVNYLTSTTILDIKEIPEHLLIIGAAYVGMEFGQMFGRFGSKVTMLEFSPRLLSKEDNDVAEAIGEILKADGVTIHTNAKTEKIETGSDGKIIATVNINGEDQQIVCSHILVAAGRLPNTDDLGLQNTGIKKDGHGFIVVNDKLETSVAGVYALGDVKGGPAFTHISYNDYIVVSKNLLEQANVSISGRPIPYCMFTDPQLGRIGLTEDEAIKKGLKIKVAKLPMTKVARAVETGETKGLIKAVVDADSKKILGAAVLSAEGGELMTVLQMAMMGGIGYDKIADTIFAHPLYAESLNNLFMNLDN